MFGREQPGFDPTDAPDVKKTSLWSQVVHRGGWFKKGEERVEMPSVPDQPDFKNPDPVEVPKLPNDVDEIDKRSTPDVKEQSKSRAA